MAIAVGDIHGCFESLQRLIDKVPVAEELVFLGDYIDRGPHSSRVVQYLQLLGRQRPCRFLRGNHEQLMLDAIEVRETIPHWLMNGGTTTLLSYGTSQRAWAGEADRRTFLGKHFEFYAGLPLYWEDDRTLYVHAGIDVGIRDMRSQDPETLLWIRDKFFRNAAQWSGKQVVFGHTPTRSMGLTGKTIFEDGPFFGIDTGCVYGGFLTAWDSETHTLWQERSTFPPGTRGG